jgi:hypothetical protein
MKISLSILLGLGLAIAPLSAGKHRKNGPCKADIAQHCGTHKGDRKAMRSCIKQNADKFSAECKAHKAQYKQGKTERKQRFAKLLETCSADIAQHCPQGANKKHTSMKCLMQNRAKVSEACRAALPQPRVRKQK